MDIDINNLTAEQRAYLEKLLMDNFRYAFDEIVDVGWEWLSTPEAAEYFQERQDRLTTFFEDSGIHKQWNDIIQHRAENGADLVTQIYDMARHQNVDETIFDYTSQERAVFNRLADNQYELVKDVTEQQVKGIRRLLIEDYAKGVNPNKTSLKRIQLEPMNGRSCSERAQLIARTETARTVNCAALMQYYDEGVQFVELLCEDGCDECKKHQGKQVPIMEALDMPTIHPNCRCRWIAADNGTLYDTEGHFKLDYLTEEENT